MATLLSRDGALELANRINAELLNWEHVAEAWNYSIWRSLDLPDWDSFCATLHPPDARRVLTGSPEAIARIENFTQLRGAGVPVWAIAAAYHVGSSTVSYTVRHRSKKVRNKKNTDVPPQYSKNAPIPRTMRKPVADVSRGARRIGLIMKESRRAVADNRETLRNLYLTEMRLAAQELETAIETLQK